MSRNKKCPYYEVDLEAEKEAEAMEASYRELIGEEEYHLLMIQAEVLGQLQMIHVLAVTAAGIFIAAPDFRGRPYMPVSIPARRISYQQVSTNQR